jgi:hypothetical protein
MLKLKIETELKSVDINLPSFDPQSSPEMFLIEIRHALVGYGFHNKYIDMILNLSNDIDEFDENMDDNPPPKTTKN